VKVFALFYPLFPIVLPHCRQLAHINSVPKTQKRINIKSTPVCCL